MTDPIPPIAPPQASDPAVLPGGRVVPRRTPPPVGGDHFRVDLERAPQAIRELEDARDQLLELKNDAVALGKITPPTRDPVSFDAARLLEAAATGGSGSLISALDSGIEQVERFIAGLRADLKRYRSTDEAIADDLR